MRSKNDNRRYRLPDYIALKLGVTLNKSKRYRLTKLQDEKLQGLKIKRLFFDIETTPNVVYSWRIGGKLNIGYHNIIEERKIICISYKWQHDDRVFNLSWDKNHNDREMIAAFIEVMNKSDELVAHNGDRFDLRWLRTRALFHRLPMWPNYRTIDTLKKTRNRFYFNSNRLDYLGQFFGVGQKLEHNGFDLWRDVMAGDKEALALMKSYCDRDVILLEDVFNILQPYIVQNTNVSVHTGGKNWGCPVCGEDDNIELLKNEITLKGYIKRVMECNTCGHVYDISNRNYGRFLDGFSKYL